jgi:hypothetical protein
MSYKELPVGEKFALVDAEDFEVLRHFKWKTYRCPTGKTTYAVTTLPVVLGSKTVRMHRVILIWLAKARGIPARLEVDHVNGNGLDNRRSNLRFCTSSQNKFNRGKKGGFKHSSYKGVGFHRSMNKWTCCIQINNKKKVSYFNEEIAAAKAYDELAKKHHGEFARLNFPEKK